MRIEIKTETELRELLGTPLRRVIDKDRASLAPRGDGYRNILENPHVGLLFMVPGRGDTLRINGRATILADAPYFDELAVLGHRPVLAVEVAIEQIFFHCAKAFLRSSLWKPESWHPENVPSRATIASHSNGPMTRSRSSRPTTARATPTASY